MSSESDDGQNDGKVVPFRRRPASRPLEPGLPGLEPDALYVFKLGPIETEEGRCFTYVALLQDGTALFPEVAESDARGLARLAPHFQGRHLYCEPRLARAGASYGFVSRRVPPELFPFRATLALSTQWGPMNPEVIPPELLPRLLEAASELWRAHPWELWTNIEVLSLRLEGPVPAWREVCVLGNGGEEFGFALYREPGAVGRLRRLREEERLQQHLREESLVLLFEEEPAWVRTEVRRITRLPVFPNPLRLSGGDFVPLSREDLVTLLAVAQALTRLSPERLVHREEVSLGGLRVTAHVRAHVPLFTGWRPPPYLHPDGLRFVVPRPPRRKISQTLVSFVEGLVPEPEGVDPDKFVTLLDLAVTTWNAVVLDTWAPATWAAGEERVEAIRAAVRALPGELGEVLPPYVEALVARKRGGFQDDARLMGGLRVRWAVEGDPRIQLQWRLLGI